MKTKTLGWIVALGAAACGFASCSQPKLECQVALAGSGLAYMAKYTLNGTPAAGCEAYVKKGEVLGLEMYHPPNTDGTSYDPSKTSLAIQSADLEKEVISYGMDKDVLNNTGGAGGGGPTSTHHPYAMGTFNTPQPTNDLCEVPTFDSMADMAFPGTGGAGGAGPGVTPAEEIKYEWKNLKVYVTAAAPGTQFSADLTYTHIDPATSQTCTFNYRVVAVWPAVGCDDGSGKPDDSLCSACSDVDAGRPVGSGISPDFATKCDPDLLMCVLVNPEDRKKADDLFAQNKADEAMQVLNASAPVSDIPQNRVESAVCGTIQ